jgi:membrane protease YdiL (CAAX protease family)
VKRDAGGLVFALVFPTLSSWVYFELFSQPNGGGGAGNYAMQAAWIVGKAIQFAFPLFWVWVVERSQVWPSKPTLRGLEFGIGFGLLVSGAGLLLYYGLLRHHPLMQELPEKVRRKATELGMPSPARYFLVVGFLSFVHSLLEEYYWRWFVFSSLRKRMNFGLATAVSAIFFAAYHVINLSAFFPGRLWTLVMPLSGCIAVGGAAWAWLYARTGSIYAPWLSHLLIDAAIFWVGYDLIFVRDA